MNGKQKNKNKQNISLNSSRQTQRWREGVTDARVDWFNFRWSHAFVLLARNTLSADQLWSPSVLDNWNQGFPQRLPAGCVHLRMGGALRGLTIPFPQCLFLRWCGNIGTLIRLLPATNELHQLTPIKHIYLCYFSFVLFGFTYSLLML